MLRSIGRRRDYFRRKKIVPIVVGALAFGDSDTRRAWATREVEITGKILFAAWHIAPGGEFDKVKYTAQEIKAELEPELKNSFTESYYVVSVSTLLEDIARNKGDVKSKIALIAKVITGVVLFGDEEAEMKRYQEIIDSICDAVTKNADIARMLSNQLTLILRNREARAQE